MTSVCVLFKDIVVKIYIHHNFVLLALFGVIVEN